MHSSPSFCQFLLSHQLPTVSVCGKLLRSEVVQGLSRCLKSKLELLGRDFEEWFQWDRQSLAERDWNQLVTANRRFLKLIWIFKKIMKSFLRRIKNSTLSLPQTSRELLSILWLQAFDPADLHPADSAVNDNLSSLNFRKASLHLPAVPQTGFSSHEDPSTDYLASSSINQILFYAFPTPPARQFPDHHRHSAPVTNLLPTHRDRDSFASPSFCNSLRYRNQRRNDLNASHLQARGRVKGVRGRCTLKKETNKNLVLFLNKFKCYSNETF